VLARQPRISRSQTAETFTAGLQICFCCCVAAGSLYNVRGVTKEIIMMVPQSSRHAPRDADRRNEHITRSVMTTLLQQFEKLRKETAIRRANADYLIAGLKQIGGIAPARLLENSRAVWHLFPMRYDPAQFNGLSRRSPSQAGRRMRGKIMILSSVILPKSRPRTSMKPDKQGRMLDEAINSPGYKRLWSAERLKTYRESFKDMKGNAQVCATTVGLSQTLLLADRSAMDHILDAIRKIRAYSAELAKKA